MTKAVGGALIVFAALVGLALPAGAQGDEFQNEASTPEITVWIHGAGGDAIEAYLPQGPRPVSRLSLMGDIADSVVGKAKPRAISEDDYYFDYAIAQFEGRIAERTGSDLDFHFDSASTLAVVGAHGYSGYWFTLCVPDIETRLTARPPDDSGYGDFDEPDTNCTAWHVTPDGEPLVIDLHLDATSGHFTKLSVAFIAVGVLGAVLGLGLALLLRRGPVRQLRGASFAFLGAGLVGAVAAPAGVIVFLSIFNAPIASHAIAADLSQAEHVIATLVPALALALPGTAFALGIARAPAPPYEPPRATPAAWGPPPYGGYPPPAPPPAAPPRSSPSPSSSPGLPSWLDES